MGIFAPYISWNAIILLGLLLYPPPPVLARSLDNTEQQKKGVGLGHENLPNNRRPSLYTEDFGDCMGNSMIKLTQFKAAYYQDNLTVVFHLDGHTSILNESLMMYIGLFAYEKKGFDLIFDPCNANISSLCPITTSNRILDGGFIPVAPSDVSGIPPLAFKLPDFEGQAVIRFYSNSTQSQIACYASTLTNGVTLSHPQVVGSIIASLVSVTFVLSIASIVYGEDVETMRAHYSHSPSLFVAFTVLHHIYFTGALTSTWPRFLTAFWSNFAPFAGMIYSESMQNSINRMIGENGGNIRVLGAHPISAGLPSGRDITDIYNVSSSSNRPSILNNGLWKRAAQQNYRIAAPSAPSSPETFEWQHGKLLDHGLPLLGNYSGFPGALAMQRIPVASAFTTGLIWFVVLLVILTPVIPAIKLTIELLIHWNALKGRRPCYYGPY
ncbi:uncharacterized protein GIQ15_00243 [Arthroderma uncinatum]|uniref:uncharacterized protein n=1 Tax=Arthroderma uncinatum TaxID=74035 RepID=UPI00144A690A|nr:uncharacterized protein GIQ15_00243 [Arthroderma uncinatum]KAF3490726.1 hypothetical protein GIQ15_00243 [Arthroderma uncinatum]